jgi:hypothetical protein
MWFDDQEYAAYNNYETLLVEPIRPSSSIINDNHIIPTNSFLYNALNQSFSVEQLLDQYNRDLLSIIKEQKEKEQEEQENDDHSEKEEEEDEKLLILKKEGENKKILPKKKKKPSADISLTEAEFLEKIILVKNKIAKLYKEYNILKKKLEEQDTEINEILAMKEKNQELHKLLNKRFFISCMENDSRVTSIQEREKNTNEVLEEIYSVKKKEKIILNMRMFKIQDTILMLKKIISYQNDENGSIVNPNEYICTICAEDKNVKYCMEPCGHLFCDACSFRIQNNCHICRHRVNKKIRMYFN